MKHIKRKVVVAASCFILGTTPAYAFNPGEALIGEKGQLLSEVSTFVGAGAYTDPEEKAGLLEASFRSPLNVLYMPDGSYLVADSENHVIRKIMGDEVTIYAGFHLLEKNEAGLPEGTLLDGPKDVAVFKYPAGMARDAQGNVYVADSGNHAIRKVDPQGNVTTIAGSGVLGSADGKGAEASFSNPMGVIVGSDGNIYVADTGNHLIRVIDKQGNVTTLNAEPERVVEVVPGVVEGAGDYKDGALAQALFNEPYAMVSDANGNLYVSDSGNSLIRYIDLKKQSVSTVAGKVRAPFYEDASLYALGEFADGPALQAAFHAPKGISLNADGSLIIADSMNHTIRLLKDGQVTTLAGSSEAESGNENGINGSNSFFNPTDVAQVGDGLLVMDTYNQLIRQYQLFKLPENVKADQKIDVVLNGEKLDFTNAAILKNSRTMLASRELAAALELDVEVSTDGQSVTITNGVKHVFTVGRLTMDVVDGDGVTTQVSLDASPFAENGSIYVPVRVLAEALGLAVNWHGATETVILRTK